MTFRACRLINMFSGQAARKLAARLAWQLSAPLEPLPAIWPFQFPATRRASWCPFQSACDDVFQSKSTLPSQDSSGTIYRRYSDNQCHIQRSGVAEKTQAEDHDLFCVARALEKMFRVGDGHRQQPSPPETGNKLEPYAHSQIQLTKLR